MDEPICYKGRRIIWNKDKAAYLEGYRQANKDILEIVEDEVVDSGEVGGSGKDGILFYDELVARIRALDPLRAQETPTTRTFETPPHAIRSGQ